MSAPDWEGFGRGIMEDWQVHCDVDASDKFDLAERFGIVRRIPGGFDPEQHDDEYGDAEPGDPWYEIAPRAASEADALRAEIERLRGIIIGVGVNLWDRAEISERDDANNQTVILWHPSGMPLMRLSIESHAPRIEPAHCDLVISDLLDVLNARAALKGGDE